LAYYQLELEGVLPENFKSLSYCPDYLYHYEDPKYTQEFLEWKGYMAWIKGCTLLVDDLLDMVIKGCEKFNIEYMDSLQKL